MSEENDDWFDGVTECFSCGSENLEVRIRWNRKILRCVDCGIPIGRTSSRCKTCEYKTRTGENHPRWKGGSSHLSSNHDHGHYILGYAAWKKEVLERDNYTCQHCQSNKNLHCHHIESYQNHPDLRINTDNGIVLCNKCHKKLHFLFNEPTALQLKWFFQNVK